MKRLGLPVFKKELLLQHHEFLRALFLYYVQEQPDKALDRVVEALFRPKYIHNDIGRKMLKLMREILEKRFKEQKVEAKLENDEQAKLISRQVKRNLYLNQ